MKQSVFSPTLSKWMKEDAPDKDIVLSSRVRLARNIDYFPFVQQASVEQLKEILRVIEKTITEKVSMPLYLIKMGDITELQRHILVEKHLISPNLERNEYVGATFLSENQQVSLMVNEEDHLRIQCMSPGFQLLETYKQANEIDDQLESGLSYSFSEQFGYLTSCPSNVGTGLRASVMLHLPTLTLTRKIDQILSLIHKFGMVVRGIYGEGSQSVGNLFQISNQLTLGKTENDIIEDLIQVVSQVIAQERQTRENLLHTSKVQLEDKIFRSLGILENSRIISSAECAKCLSDVQLGIDVGLIEYEQRDILSELMTITQPALLQQYASKVLHPSERDIKRAALIREKIKK